MATSCMKALLKSKNNNENRALCTQQELLSSLDPPLFFSYCALSFLTLTLSLRAKDYKTVQKPLEFYWNLQLCVQKDFEE